MSGEKWQHFNQLLSAKGLPAAVLDEETEARSDRIADSLCESDEVSERNSSLFGQAWAAKAFQGLLEDWDGLGEIPGAEIPEDVSRLHGEPDQSTLWVIVHGDHTRERIAIRNLGQYRQVAEKRLAHIHFCQARISTKCEGSLGAVAAANGLAPSKGHVDSVRELWHTDDDPRWGHEYSRICRKLIGLPNAVEPYEVVYFGVKRGMYIVTAKMCSVCRDFLRNCGPVEDINTDVQWDLGTAETGYRLGGDQPDLVRGWYWDVDADDKLLQVQYPETAIHRRWSPPWPPTEGR